MQIHQIRSATLIITYNNKRFLIDPWLMPKNYMEGFEAGLNSHIRQPRVELPVDIEEIVNVDAVILTHYHPDHFDDFAAKALNKDIPFFVQSEVDLKNIQSFGFKDVRVIKEETDFAGVKLYKTNCQHGRREIIKPLCEEIGMPYESMGVVFKAQNEKTLYLAGDTIWCNEVQDALAEYCPDVIIINACGAATITNEKIIMDIQDVKTISNYARKSIIIASHMDTVSHLTVTRNHIKKLNLKNVIVPEDNEVLSF